MEVRNRLLLAILWGRSLSYQSLPYHFLIVFFKTFFSRSVMYVMPQMQATTNLIRVRMQWMEIEIPGGNLPLSPEVSNTIEWTCPSISNNPFKWPMFSLPWPTLLGLVFGPWTSPLIMARLGSLGSILPAMMLNVKNISEFMPSDVGNELRGMTKSYAQQNFPKSCL